jgi:hypothetical protein
MNIIEIEDTVIFFPAVDLKVGRLVRFPFVPWERTRLNILTRSNPFFAHLVIGRAGEFVKTWTCDLSGSGFPLAGYAKGERARSVAFCKPFWAGAGWGAGGEERKGEQWEEMLDYGPHVWLNKSKNVWQTMFNIQKWHSLYILEGATDSSQSRFIQNLLSRF